MYEDQKHIECVVREMLKSLCKVSIAFSQELHIQGTLGITVDRNGIFLVQINEILNLNSAVHSANLHSNDNDNLSVPFVKIEPDDPPNYQSHDISRNSKHISQIAAAYRSELSHTELTTPANEQFAPLEYNLHQIEKSNSEDSFGIERNDCYKDANNQKECGNLDNDKLNRRQQTCTNDSRYKTAKTEAAETVKVIPRLESGITELCEEKLLSPIHRVASDNPDRISLLPRPQILPGNLSTHKFLGRSEFIRDFNNKSNVKEEDECDEGDTRNHSNGRNIRNSSFMKDDFIYDMPYIPRKVIYIFIIKFISRNLL